MRLLKTKTSISLPEGFAVNITVDYETGCPYILLQFLPAKFLQDWWFDANVIQDELHSRRIHVSRDLEDSMLQLYSFRFHKGGWIEFDHNEAPVGIGPIRDYDIDAAVDLFERGQTSGTAVYIEYGSYGSS